MNIIKRSSLAIAVMTVFCSGYLHAFSVTNNSGFYLNPKDPGDGCPTAQIAPNGKIESKAYWCGFVACATDGYDNDRGCLEKSGDKKSLTEGGYATWFSISFNNQSTCGVPDGNVYQCKIQNGGIAFDYLKVIQKYSAGDKKGQPVELSKPSNYKNKGPKYRGVNISGLEYDGTFLDAMYQHPDKPDIRYFVEQGMNTIRLPIRWEFLVSTASNNQVESSNPTSKNINTMYLDSVYDTVEKYLKSGVAVDLDLHNYMRFCKAGKDVGQANEPTDPVANQCEVMNAEQLAYIWGLIAKKFQPLAAQYPDLLMFEIMNEPYSFVDDSGQPVAGQTIKTPELFKMEVAAVKEIRKYAKDNYILMSGNFWDPLHGWVEKLPFPNDVANGKVFTKPNLEAEGIDVSRIVMDMHQYFDYNFSGTHKDCQKYESYTHFQQAMDLIDKDGKDIFGQWMKDNHMKVFLGEFGSSNTKECKTAMNFMLRYVEEHAYIDATPENGGFIGWTAWRGNRHGGSASFSPFNFLQKADFTVYGANGTESSPAGTGIVGGEGNSLMLEDEDGLFSFSKYLMKSN